MFFRPDMEKRIPLVHQRQTVLTDDEPVKLGLDHHLVVTVGIADTSDHLPFDDVLAVIIIASEETGYLRPDPVGGGQCNAQGHGFLTL